MGKVHRLRTLAEKTRAEREAAQKERRDQERALRAREEYQYAALVRSTDATTETYLEQLLSATIHTTAATQAVNEQLVERPTPKLVSSLDKEDYVCDLLDNFIVPLVCHR